MATTPSVIYDFGAHEGLNIPYYLARAHQVVAVEANANLAELIETTYDTEVRDGRLVVINALITGNGKAEHSRFYIHKKKSFLSTAIMPSVGEIQDYVECLVPQVSVADILSQFPNPYYVKIDLEGSDASILVDLLLAGQRPSFLSVEGHDPSIFGLLNGLGGYRYFNLVRGYEVGSMQYYENAHGTESGRTQVSFPHHSAGPFGNDIPTPWSRSLDFFQSLRVYGTGWYDIHASAETPRNVAYPNVGVDQLLRKLTRLAYWHLRTRL